MLRILWTELVSYDKVLEKKETCTYQEEAVEISGVHKDGGLGKPDTG